MNQTFVLFIKDYFVIPYGSYSLDTQREDFEMLFIKMLMFSNDLTLHIYVDLKYNFAGYFTCFNVVY